MLASLFFVKLLLIQNFPCLFKGTLHEGFHSLSTCLVILVLCVPYATNNCVGGIRKQQVMAYMDIWTLELVLFITFTFWSISSWNPLLPQIGFDPQISVNAVKSV